MKAVILDCDGVLFDSASVDYRPFFRLMVPVENLHEILADLRTSYRLAMATNRGRTIPDMLIECARRLDVEHEAAVYVGDADGDRKAAAAAGMSFVAVGERCNHPLIIPHIGELKRVLARWDFS